MPVVTGETASTDVVTCATVELGSGTDTTLSRASAGVLAVEGVNVLLNGGALGTPSGGTLTNCTGLPAAGVVGGALVASGALGTPLSGTLTNCTGLPTTVVANEATDTTCFPTFVTAATGELGQRTNANLTYNSNTGAFGLGVAAGNSLTCNSIEVGAATDTTISRASAGDIQIEANIVYRAGGTRCGCGGRRHGRFGCDNGGDKSRARNG